MRHPAAHLIVLGCLCTPLASVWGQLPLTQITNVYPPGGRVGTSVEVKVAGSNLVGVRRLVFSHPGIRAEAKWADKGEFQAERRPIAGSFVVTIAEDVPVGAYDVRAIGRYGVSNPRLFSVGQLPEVTEAGGNASAEKAQKISIPATVNGRLDGSQEDFYSVEMKAGERVILDCSASRIDSRADAILVVVDAQERELARSQHYHGLDPFLDFTAPADGTYRFALRDFFFTGGADYYYRLSVHRGPHIDYVFPPMIRADGETKVDVYGRRLPGGTPVDGGPQGLVRLEQSVSASSLADSFPGRTPLRAAANSIRQFRLANSAPVTLAVTDLPIIRESADNDAPEQATKITAPADIAGRFYPRGDKDWYEFEAAEDGIFYIDLMSHRLGLNSDPTMVVQRVTTDKAGKETVSVVARVDDDGTRKNLIGTDFDISHDDPVYRLTAKANTRYRISVRDQSGLAADPRLVYRLSIRPAKPDFQLLALAKEFKVANNNIVGVFSPSVRRGGTNMLEMRVLRQDGFRDEIEIRAEGLPDGVHMEPVKVPAGGTSASVIFAADADAKPWAGPVRLVGVAKSGEEVLQREAAAASVIWGTGNRTTSSASFRLMSGLVLTVAEAQGPALVRLGTGKELTTSLGGQLEVPIKILRDAGLDVDLKLVATGLPKELKPADITVKKGANEGKLVVAATNAKAKAGEYTFYLRSDVKYGHLPNVEAVALAERDLAHVKQIIAAADAEAKKLAATEKEAVAAATAADTAARKTVDELKKLAADAARISTDLEQIQRDLLAGEQAQGKEQKASAGQSETLQKKHVAALEALKKTNDALAAQTNKLEEQRSAKKAAMAQQAAAKAGQQKVAEQKKRAVPAQTASEKALAAAKNANAKKNIDVAVISTPIKLHVVPSPLRVSLSEAPTLVAGAKVSVGVAVQRMYGFAEDVKVVAKLPKNAAGITVAELQLKKGVANGNLVLAANDKVKPGDYSISVEVTGTFNKIAVKTTETLSITVAAAGG